MALSTRTAQPSLSAETTALMVAVSGCQWLSVAVSGCQWLRRALKDLSPRSSEAFVDLGSRKGKSLLIAGRLAYIRVIGVEIDEELAQYAVRNVEQVRPRLRAQVVDCVMADVLK